MNKKNDLGMKGVFLAVLVAMGLNACATAPVKDVEARGSVDASAEVKALAQGLFESADQSLVVVVAVPAKNSYRVLEKGSGRICRLRAGSMQGRRESYLRLPGNKRG